MDFFVLKIAGLSRLNNLENTVFQPCHCRLVFKLDLLFLQCFMHICFKN